MPMSTTERARKAATTRWAKLDREQRAAEMLPLYIAAAVKRIVDAAPALTDDQRTRLRAILTDPPKGGGR